ncbi:hypothetical protein GE21DRAFT_1072116 [Neurospora crassa]|nr:hypothetical protein GE21DRAFT_1072116 [Neurospora crassa]
MHMAVHLSSGQSAGLQATRYEGHFEHPFGCQMRIEEKTRVDERSAMEKERKVVLNGGGDGGYYEVSLSVMEMLGKVTCHGRLWRGGGNGTANSKEPC